MYFERHNLKLNNKFIFNGYDLSNKVVVESIIRQLVPTTSIQATSIIGRKGLAYKRKEVGSRLITLTLRFLEDSYEQLQERAIEVASLLYSDEPKKLELRDSTLFNYAILQSGEALVKSINTATVEIVFKCLDPFNYGEQKTLALTGTHSIINPGAETSGTINLVATGGAPIKVTLNDGDYLFLNELFEAGTVVSIDLEKETVSGTSGSIMGFVTLESNFFKIPNGTSTVKVEGATGTLIYRERWI